jgi:iron complex transport system ATP-binding protein
MTELFSIKNLSIRRGDVCVLDRIHWTMQRGEHWVILGANGSGKTSLLKALTGYMPPTDGSIVLLGEEFGESDWRELRRHVGVVSASISHLCHDEDEALEIVAGGKHAMIGFWGELSAAEQRRARRLLGLLGVGYAAARRWEVLSQGERQRVLIARALMADPAILILDEPCSGLDPVAREHFLGDLRRLALQKKAPGLVLVTHHIEEILPEFTHLLALENGRVHYDGAIAQGLTSKTLSTIFHAPLTVRRQAGRYRLQGIS